MVQAQFLQAGVDGCWDVLDIGNHLCGNKEFLSRHLTLLDSSTQLFLRVVYLGAIQMGVPDGNGSLGCVNQLLVQGRVGIRFIPCRTRAIPDLLELNQSLFCTYSVDSTDIGNFVTIRKL